MEQADNTVIVVEDDKLVRETLATMLEEAAISVVQCESAEAALRVLASQAEHVAMLITDVKLDGKIDGVELAYFVRQSYPEIRVVVTSGIAPERLPKSATFLPKPWRREDMLRQARRLLH